MTQPIRLDGLTAKIESVYATDSVPVVGTNDVRVAERVWSGLRVSHAFANTREDAATGSLISLFPAVPGGRIVELDIAWDARGAGAAYSVTVLPEADPLFRSCGMARTDDFTVSFEEVAYDPASTGHASCTIYAYAAGIRYQITGCRGNVVWPITAGQLGIIRFRMQGLLVADPVDEVLPAGFLYDTTIPQPAQAMTLAVGGVSPDVVTAELDLGAQIQRLEDANAAEGVAEFAISGFDPTYRLSARVPAGATPLATWNPYADMRARTVRTIAQTLGSVQFNRIKLAVVDARVSEDPEHTENNQFTSWDVLYTLQDATITFD